MQTEQVIQHIVSWLKDYLETSHQKGFVIGISGGIDSAVTSTLCAMTGYPLLNLELPIHQEKNQAERARQHIEWLKQQFDTPIDSIEIDLTGTFDALVNALPATESSDKVNLALANTRSRLRMTTLYYFAGLHNYLVAGTGNKVEDFGVGFYTKYGDGGVDLSPIADLMKSEVYQIAAYLGINMDIQKAKPTDGLFGDDRSDEDQLGASYDELEWAMTMQEEGHTSEEFEGRQKEVFDIYARLNRINQHKMVPIPVCEIPKELK